MSKTEPSSWFSWILSKAFDTVDRETFWKILRIYVCPDKFINVERSFHDSMTGRVTVGGDVSDAFPVHVCHGA